MQSRFRTVIRMMAVGGLLLAAGPLTRAQDQAPAPAPMNGASAADPCDPCFKRCCKPKCQPACPPLFLCAFQAPTWCGRRSLARS